MTMYNTHEFSEEIMRERRTREANIKKFDRVKTNTSRGWQSINVGADRIGYCTLDSIYETARYTLEIND